MNVSLKPEVLFTIGNLTVTNSLLTTLLTSLVLMLMFLLTTRRLRLIPKTSQNIVEVAIETLYGLNRELAGERVSRIFPWFVSFFLFILTANVIGLLPGFGTIGFFRSEDHAKILVPLLRPVNSDLNMTLGLALVSVVTTHVLSVTVLGAREYLSRFFSLNPVYLFVGLLEVVSEITKIVSLSFRLFGNIFAGEAVLARIATLFAFVLPLPFIVLEIIVGFVQALVFSMLTMVFMVILTAKHESTVTEREVRR